MSLGTIILILLILMLIWRRADLAAQCKLGLFPVGRLGNGSDRCAHPGSVGSNIDAPAKFWG
jgi:lipoprotein signal peptidase